MEWYDWRNVRESLVTFGRAIQGVAPYTVVIEPDETKCPTGYCNFTKRRIAANPKLFPDRTPREQYGLTKALLVHEAGHRRFTTPGQMSGVVHLVSNLLEDERVERLMSDAFAGLRHLVMLLAQAMYLDAEPLDPATDSPGQVLAAILQARWAERVGKPLKGSLSSKNRELWERIMPVAREAWTAPDTAAVDLTAKRIVDILGLKDKDVPQWLLDLQDRLGGLEGERGNDDVAETGKGIADSSRDSAEATDKGFDALPSSKAAGSAEFPIEPKPYIDLV